MLKVIFKVVKKIIMAVLFIYVYNKISLPLDVVVPINVFTVAIVAVCGLPSIVMLIIFSLFCI